jgi:tetratricopeptide (TPR) repeat protein
VVAYSIRHQRFSGIRLGLLILAIPYGLVSHFLFPGTILFAERLLYLPSVGFILVLAMLIELYWDRVYVRGLAGMWIVVLCGLTWSYSQAWTSPERLFSTALESRPGSARMHINLGHLALEDQDPARARKEAEMALAIEPTSPEAMVNLGAAFETLGNPREALAWFARGTEVLDGTYGLAHINHCRLGVALGDLSGAEKSCERSIALRGDLASSWGALGRYLEGVGQLSDAEKAFQNGVSREPSALLPLHELGGFYSRQKRVEKRNEVMLKLLELSPEDAQLRQALVQETRRQLKEAKAQGNEKRVQTLGQQLRGLQSLP